MFAKTNVERHEVTGQGKINQSRHRDDIEIHWLAPFRDRAFGCSSGQSIRTGPVESPGSDKPEAATEWGRGEGARPFLWTSSFEFLYSGAGGKGPTAVFDSGLSEEPMHSKAAPLDPSLS